MEETATQPTRAIIETGGKQFNVAVGDMVVVEKLGCEDGKPFTFDKVMAIVGGDNSIFGKPYVEGARVVAQSLGGVKGKKLVVYKYKSKKGFHKKKGHRQPYTKLKITEISA